MGKFRNRIITVVLLATWSITICSGGGSFEYSSLGIYASQEDIGEITLFILYVIIGEIGKKLDKGYVCPVYCAVDHEHFIRRSYGKEVHPKRDTGVYGPDLVEYPKQPESDIRPEGRVRISYSDSDSLVGI